MIPAVFVADLAYAGILWSIRLVAPRRMKALLGVVIAYTLIEAFLHVPMEKVASHLF